MMIEQFVRKSFPVDAVQVTVGNIEDVANWCDGEIRDNTENISPEGRQDRYIKVRVHNPLTERQTKAFPGDWVLYAGKGYKVYTDKAFRKSFDENIERPKGPALPEGVTGSLVVDGNVFDTHVAGGGGGGNNTNPGGTPSVGA